MIRGFEGVLLDLYGTLVTAGSRAGRAPHLRAMANTLGADVSRFEHDWTQSLPDRVFGRLGPLEATVATIAGRQGLRPSRAQVHRAVEIRLAFSKATLEACAPVLPALESMRSAGVRFAVVTDCSEETARLWSSSPLGRRIEVAVFSCVEGVCKPDPRMYRRALDQLGLPAARCAYVGDGGSRELTGAEALGLTAFQYRFPGDLGQPDTRFDPDTEWRGPSLPDLAGLLAATRRGAEGSR